MAKSPGQVHWVVYLVPPLSWEAVPIARNPKVLLFLAFALGLTGAPWSGPAWAQGEAMLVRVDTVKWVPLSQTVPVIGRLVAQQAGVVAARINGPVEAFRVQVGDRIEAGQTIAVLNAAAIEARRDLYASRLNEARAMLSIEKAQLALARQDYKRNEKLKKSAAFNPARFDDSRQKVVIAKAEMRQAETAIVSAKADLELAEINLYNAEIRAPYAGVVTERLTEAGAYVQVGDPVIRMIGDRTLEVEADVPFQHLGGLEPGIEVRLRLDDGTEHSAVVRALVPSENPLTRTRAVRFVPDIGKTLRPLAHEQSVTLSIPIGPARQVLSVHKDAIIKRRGQDIVFVVTGEGAEARPVRLGVAVGGRFEVLSGLSQGDRVVVRGNERLRPGAKVRVIGES
ncbi:MAG: efflux RND transporter periplasmic adaptor subunit [Proteobacteria bacterium]|nr:efflux RND transporter periplasmic adaptor subunit [Pseudomonadota bacterium]